MVLTLVALGLGLQLLLLRTRLNRWLAGPGEDEALKAPLLAGAEGPAAPSLGGSLPKADAALLLTFFAFITTMFIWANSSPGASVQSFVSAGGTTTQMPTFAVFSLVGTIRDMWRAKDQSLSVLIALLSGVWPYTKLGLLFACVLVPYKKMGQDVQGRLAICLDALGKWSLLDAYVLMMMTVAFRLTIQTPAEDTDGEFGPLSADVYVKPEIGCYTFLYATVVSLVACHLLLALQRLAWGVRVPVGGAKSALAESPANDPATKGTFARRAFYHLVTANLVLCLATHVLGGLLPNFIFKFYGVTAKVMDGGDVRVFSLTSLASHFVENSLPLFWSSRYHLLIGFLLFSYVMPMLHVLGCLVLWRAKLTPRQRFYWLVFTEVTFAWAAGDVFVFSVLASLWQIERFALFVVGDKCDALTPILARHFSDFLDGDARCFDLKTELGYGIWVFAFSCVLFNVMGRFVIRKAKLSLEKDGDGGAQEAILESHAVIA